MILCVHFVPIPVLRPIYLQLRRPTILPHRLLHQPSNSPRRVLIKAVHLVSHPDLIRSDNVFFNHLRRESIVDPLDLWFLSSWNLASKIGNHLENLITVLLLRRLLGRLILVAFLPPAELPLRLLLYHVVDIIIQLYAADRCLEFGRLVVKPAISFFNQRYRI